MVKWISLPLRNWIPALRNLPVILRIGAVVFVISGALDLFYHGLSAYWPGRLDAVLGPDGYDVHVALFMGMVLMVIGVIRTKPQNNPKA